DFVWVEDAVPAGAVASGSGEDWNWISANPTPFSGSLAHQSNLVAGYHHHYFFGPNTPLSIGVGERLFTYIYLDPANPPTEVMLQFLDSNGWEHRAYWGSNQINLGTDGTNSRRFIGGLPPTGVWARLEIPASLVGLEGSAINGVAFTLFNGRATWDRMGRAPALVNPSFNAVAVGS